MFFKKRLPISLALALLLSQSGPVLANSVTPVLNPEIDGAWIGNGISYAPYRDGESPVMGSVTSKENILEDLKLIAKNWQLIRLYGTGQASERILQVITEHKLPIKVMQGAWISGLQTQQQNDAEVAEVIRLANAYPEVVVAVNVGNEILVDWSAHKMRDINQVIAYVRQTRQAIKQPVTVNDDYNFWNKPSAQQLAKEVDFIGLHAYAFWNNITLDKSLSWTQGIYEDIQQRFPTMQLVMGESGWPTSRIYNDGSYEGSLIGEASVPNLKTFFDQYNDWINQEKIVSFYFEAFDEKWKGGFDGANPDDKAEKHWGVYYSNRQPKIELP
ncbi:MAG: hypothetical protein JXK16_08495 [Thiotrichales bacterium]|nr:hypothetical protein [Thiotrichales bacterium]